MSKDVQLVIDKIGKFIKMLPGKLCLKVTDWPKPKDVRCFYCSWYIRSNIVRYLVWDSKIILKKPVKVIHKDVQITYKKQI